MKGICPVCASEYPIPDEKVQAKVLGLPVRCRQCATVFRVYPDGRPATVDRPAPKPTAATPPPAPVPPPAPAAPTPKPAAPPPKPSAPEPIKVDAANLEPTGRETTARRPIVRSTFINQAAPTVVELGSAQAPKATPAAPVPAPTPPRPTSTPKPFEFKPQTGLPEGPVCGPPATAPVERPGGKKKKKKNRHRQRGAAGAVDIPAPAAGARVETPARAEEPAEPDFDWAASKKRPREDFGDDAAAEPDMTGLDEPAFVMPEPKMPDFEKYADDSPFKRKPLFGRTKEFADEVSGEGEPTETESPEAAPAADETAATTDAEDDFPYKGVVRAAWKQAAKEKPPTIGERPSGMGTTMKIFLVFAALAIIAAAVVVTHMVRDQIIDYQNNLAKRNEASQIQQEEDRKKLDYRLKFQTALDELKPGSPAAYQKAIETLDQSLAAKPDFYQATAEKALLLALLDIEYGKTEGVDNACTLAQQAVEREPKVPYALRAMAACDLAKDKLGEAEKTVHDAIVVKEGDELEDAESNYLLAHVYLKKNARDKAEFALQSSIAENPLNFRAHHLLADVYASQKKWQLALESEEKALKLIEDNADAKRRIELYQSNLRGDLAQTGAVTGLPAEVGADMDKKAKAKELALRIEQAMRKGSSNEALGMVNELLKLGVMNGEAMLAKCRIMLNSNQYAAAVESCGAARSVNPDAHYFLGAAYEAMGNKSSANDSYQAYLNSRPNGSHAAEVRSILGITKEE
jgi:predicted Zn finger-like uncharacterized protein